MAVCRLLDRIMCLWDPSERALKVRSICTKNAPAARVHRRIYLLILSNISTALFITSNLCLSCKSALLEISPIPSISALTKKIICVFPLKVKKEAFYKSGKMRSRTVRRRPFTKRWIFYPKGQRQPLRAHSNGRCQLRTLVSSFRHQQRVGVILNSNYMRL